MKALRRLMPSVLLTLSLAGFALEASAQATAFPARPIKIVVPFEPAGPVDYLARSLGQELAKHIGQAVVIENRPGAGGTIGIDGVAHAPPDGYTLAMGSSSNLAVAPSLYARLPYEPARDLAPVVLVARTSYVLTVNPNVPVKNLRELIDLAHAKKGVLSYGSAGSGSMSNLAGELLKAMAGMDILHVPYKGAAPYVNAAVAGQIDMIFPDLATAKPFAQAGKLRMLAVTGEKRAAIAPELPTIAEAGVPGYAVDIWYGIVAPAATPRELVAKLNAAFVAVLKTPEFRQQLAERGFDAAPDTPDEFAATIRSDTEKFGRVAKAAGIKPL